MQNLQDLIAEVETHVRMVWRHRWIALTVTTIIWVAGAVYIFSLPDTFRVTAKVHLDTQSMLKPLLRGLAVDAGMAERAAQMMRRTLLVRPNLEKVARETDMDLEAKTPKEMESLLDRLGKEINVAQAGRTSDIFTLSYENEDPQRAKRVVDALLNVFLEGSLGAARIDTGVTQDFLDRQIKEYEAKLEAAETRLKEFKRNNLGLLPGQADYLARRQALLDTLRDARLELREAEDRRDALKRQIEDPNDPSLWLAPDLGDPLDERIQALEKRVDELLLRYTEQHPDVISTRALIAELEARKQKLLSVASDDAQAHNVENPVYQGLKVALSDAEGKVAALQARVEALEARERKLNELIDEGLRVEAELKRLNRDYGIDMTNYKALVQRREQAKITYEADQTGDEFQMRVIEPPRAPLLPTGPDRLRWGVLVLVVGLGTGTGFAWLISQIRPVFFDGRQLTSVTDLPLLGNVAIAWAPGQSARLQLEALIYVMAAVVLLAGYWGLFVFEQKSQGLVSELLRLREIAL